MSYFLFLSIGTMLVLISIVLKLRHQELGYELCLNLGISEAIRDRLGAEITNAYFQVKVISRANIYCRIVRADDRMVVTKYLCHSSGGSSPTLELHGEDTSWFRKFTGEFDRMWELATEWPSSPEINFGGGEL